MTGSRPTSERPWRTALLLLLAWSLPTAWLGWQRSELRVDPENRALKAIGTREAHDLSRMAASFGSDQTVLLGYAARGGGAVSADLRKEIAQRTHPLRVLPGVARVQLSDTGTPALVCATVTLQDDPEQASITEVASRVVAAARAACPPAAELHVSGQPLAERAIASAVSREQRGMVPAIAGGLLLVLLAFYRSVLLAGLVLLPAAGSILWTGGLLHVLGHRADPLTVLLDPVLLTVGVAAGVHFVETHARLGARLGPRRVAAAVRAELWRPTLLTTLTTMIGFLSLLTSPIPAVQTFGVYAAFGVAASASVVLGCLPTWLAAAAPAGLRARRWALDLGRYVGWLRRRSAAILGTTLAVAVVMVGAAATGRIDNDPLRVLSPRDPFRRDAGWLIQRLGGLETFGLLAPAHSEALDPEWLLLLAAAATGDPAVAGPAGPPLRAADGSILLRALLAPSGSHAREHLFDGIDSYARDLGFPEVHAVGSAVQIARDSGKLIRGQLESLLLVVPLLGLVVGLGLRSARLGLLSLLPNAMPCALLQGSMALAGRPLSVATVMIGAAMMGVIVDDTIHLLHHYRHHRVHGRARDRSLLAALATAGRPITITSVVLTVGLGAGVLGSLESTVEFSALAAATIAVAWLLDVLVLPASLLIGHRPAPRPEPR